MEDKEVDLSDLSVAHRKKSLVIEVKLLNPAGSHFLRTVDSLKDEAYIKKVSWNK
ncbi:hypothetical protein [Flavobacterium sp.]|uniref:hypothetical protein n=1 Tax=Flavobacterium sp. TaxID=239 RepID=UPI00403385DF